MIPEPKGIYVVCGSTDLRMGIDGYARIVQDHYERNPMDSRMYCFCNRQHNKLKILYWDLNGFWLMYKRLEKGTFKWPKEDDKCMKVEYKQMEWLLQGLHIEQKRVFKEVKREFV